MFNILTITAVNEYSLEFGQSGSSVTILMPIALVMRSDWREARNATDILAINLRIGQVLVLHVR